jgi:hypothetical protein
VNAVSSISQVKVEADCKVFCPPNLCLSIMSLRYSGPFLDNF